ncbi:MAG: FAD-binding protein [Gammaproteobacteria bacterium]|jgi:FAD/FMN-containing dehydrogenase|nr:FAD-binding protein [Gammaproteobacteria bacterium]MBT5600678.1 FAD-binding protein [Gammaproteobacteria bacterium]
MARWKNWSGRQQAAPEALHFLRSQADAAALVNRARLDGKGIRVAGSGHSHSPLVLSSDWIIDVSGLAGITDVDHEQKTAWIYAGTPMYSLGRALHDEGLALHNQGDIDRQTIAGACATGTHGTGRKLGNMSSAVLAVEVITGKGEVVICSADHEPEFFAVARLGLGAAGIITRLQLQLRESYKLRENGLDMAFSDLFQQLPELAASHDRFEFFWHPQSDRATVKLTDETTDQPEYPLAEEGRRCAWNYEVLPSYRPHLHTEMEYSVAEELGPACLAELRQMIQTEFSEIRWPVEYRTLAADNVWLSTASERQTVTISVHEDIRLDDSVYFAACERIFRRYQGRPHWGKVNNLGAKEFQESYPHWLDWWRVRDQFDPDDVFVNDYLASIRP